MFVEDANVCPRHLRNS